MSQLMESLSHRKGLIGLIIAVCLLVGGTIFVAGDHLQSSVVGTVDTSTYQAVHLDNGQSYFGRVTTINDGSVTLIDVFYFLDGSKKTLVKRTDDSITLNRDHVLATENLQGDGAIMKAILKYKANKN